MIRVEVIRAWPGRFESVTVDLPADARVGDALAAAGWQLDGEWVALAVFGRAASLETPVQDGDRVELLRPLQCDPMQARRRRAQARRPSRS
jgi:hypothetical protein